MATQAAAAKDPSITALLADPFALTPGFKGAPQPDGDTPYEDKAAGAWVGPFMMAGINTKAVHRTNFLAGHPWGESFQYCEMQMLSGPPAENAGGTGGFNFGAGGLPKPGEGPSREERETGFYDLVFIAEAADGRTVRAAVQGDMDPELRLDGQDPRRGCRLPRAATSRAPPCPAAAGPPPRPMDERPDPPAGSYAGLTFTLEN